MIESMNGGAFLNLMSDLAYKALDKLADNSQQWDFTSCHDKSAQNPKKGGIHELKGEAELNLRMDAIVRRHDALSVGKPSMLQTHFQLRVVLSVLVPCTKHRIVHR
jgi:hypothetical protein